MSSAPLVRILRPAASALLVLVLLAAVAIAQDDAAKQKEQAAQRDFNATAALQNGGLYARAAGKWEEFLSRYPDDERVGKVHYYLGICRLYSKQYDKAAERFRLVLTKYPKLEQIDGARYNLGMALFRKASDAKQAGQFKAAAAALGDVPAKHADSKYAPRALYFQGESLYAAGDADAALEAYKKLIQTYPKDAFVGDAYYALGVTQQELQQYDAAAATFSAFLNSAALADHRHAREISLRLAMTLYDQKKYDEAESRFAKVAELPDFEHADFALLRRAQCLVEMEKPADAAKLLAEFSKRYPESAYKSAALLTQGRCHFLSEKFEDAVGPLREAAKAEQPDQAAEATYWLGRTHLEQQQPEQALQLLEPALQKFSQTEFGPYLEFARIDALFEIDQRRAETVALYEKFIQQHGDHELMPEARYMASFASLGLDDFARARQHAETFLADEALAQHALAPAVLYVAGESHLLADENDAGADVSKALAHYERLANEFPEDERTERARVRIGWCLYRQEKYADAVGRLSQALGKTKTPSLAAEAQLLIGRSHSAAGREKEAVAAFDAALAADPKWPRTDEVLLAAALSLRTLDDLDAAAARLERLNNQFKSSSYRAQALFELGDIAARRKQHDEAVKQFNQVLAEFADSEFAPPAAYGAAAALFAQEKYKPAVDSLQRLFDGKPTAELAGRGRYLRGLCRQRLQEYAPAIADFEAFLGADPPPAEEIDARYAMALCNVGLKKNKEAADQLAAIIKEKPDYAHADKVYYEMGHALLAADEAEQAAAAFTALTEKTPDSPHVAEAYFHVGRHYETAVAEAGEQAAGALLKQATDAYTAGLDKADQPQLREKLQYKIGELLYRRDAFDAAATRLLAQIKEFPQGELYGPGAFLAAECLFRQDQFDKARPLYEDVAGRKVEKYHAQALYRAGACAAAVKNWRVSQQHYTGLLNQFPKFEQAAEARYGLGWAIQNQGRLAEAAEQYRQIASQPTSEAAAKANFMLGEIAFGQEKYEDAVEQFLKTAVGYPYKQWQALAYYEAGRCWIELGNKEQAIKSLKTVVEKYPDHEKAKSAAALLADLQK